MSGYAGQQFVGIDLHRRRSVVVRTTESGEVLESIQILNDVDRLGSVIARAGEAPEVVLEATTAGSGRSTRLRKPARMFIWRTLWASRRSSIAGSRTTSGTRPTWPISCGWAGFQRGLDRAAGHAGAA